MRIYEEEMHQAGTSTSSLNELSVILGILTLNNNCKASPSGTPFPIINLVWIGFQQDTGLASTVDTLASIECNHFAPHYERRLALQPCP